MAILHYMIVYVAKDYVKIAHRWKIYWDVFVPFFFLRSEVELRKRI